MIYGPRFRTQFEDIQISALWLLIESDNRTELIFLFQTLCWIKGFCGLSLYAICFVPLCPGNQDTMRKNRKEGTFSAALHRSPEWGHDTAPVNRFVWHNGSANQDGLHIHAPEIALLCGRRGQPRDKVLCDHCCSTLSGGRGNTPLPRF